jgi:hypothetical protein
VSERYGRSIVDAMIAASALHADCETLWSDEMHDGMNLENRLRIVDPSRGRVKGDEGRTVTVSGVPDWRSVQSMPKIAALMIRRR